MAGLFAAGRRRAVAVSLIIFQVSIRFDFTAPISF
jgi:hypothetical protein